MMVAVSIDIACEYKYCVYVCVHIRQGYINTATAHRMIVGREYMWVISQSQAFKCFKAFVSFGYPFNKIKFILYLGQLKNSLLQI